MFLFLLKRISRMPGNYRPKHIGCGSWWQSASWIQWRPQQQQVYCLHGRHKCRWADAGGESSLYKLWSCTNNNHLYCFTVSTSKPQCVLYCMWLEQQEKVKKLKVGNHLKLHKFEPSNHPWILKSQVLRSILNYKEVASKIGLCNI